MSSLNAIAQAVAQENADRAFHLHNVRTPSDVNEDIQALEDRGIPVVRRPGSFRGQPKQLILAQLHPASPGRARALGDSVGNAVYTNFAPLEVHVSGAMSLLKAIGDGLREGRFSEFRVVSSWRSYEHQAALHRQLGSRNSARPGNSLHESGIAIDIARYYSSVLFPHLAEEVRSSPARGKILRWRIHGQWVDVIEYNAPINFFKRRGKDYGWIIPRGYPKDHHYEIASPEEIDFDQDYGFGRNESILLADSFPRQSEENEAPITRSTESFVGGSLDSYLRSSRVTQLTTRSSCWTASADELSAVQKQIELASADYDLAADLSRSVERKVESSLTFDYASGVWGDGKTGGKVG